MSNFQDLPDELILKVLSYSKIKALITCGQTSRRIRRISRDNSLWMTVTLKKKIVKTELLELILGKGCTILRISNSTILGSLGSNIKSQLRVLNLSQTITDYTNCIYRSPIIDVLEELLSCCCSLRCLMIEGLWLTPNMAKSICNNSKTLEVLNLRHSSVDELSSRWPQHPRRPLGSSYLKEILECCQELKEVDFNEVEGLSNGDLEDLAKSIPANVEKLNLTGSDLMDTRVKILLSRCNKIKIRS